MVCSCRERDGRRCAAGDVDEKEKKARSQSILRFIPFAQGGDLTVHSEGLGRGCVFTALMRLGDPVWPDDVLDAPVIPTGSGDARSSLDSRISMMLAGMPNGNTTASARKASALVAAVSAKRRSSGVLRRVSIIELDVAEDAARHQAAVAARADQLIRGTVSASRLVGLQDGRPRRATVDTSYTSATAKGISGASSYASSAGGRRSEGERESLPDGTPESGKSLRTSGGNGRVQGGHVVGHVAHDKEAHHCHVSFELTQDETDAATGATRASILRESLDSSPDPARPWTTSREQQQQIPQATAAAATGQQQRTRGTPPLPPVRQSRMSAPSTDSGSTGQSGFFSSAHGDTKKAAGMNGAAAVAAAAPRPAVVPKGFRVIYAEDDQLCRRVLNMTLKLAAVCTQRAFYFNPCSLEPEMQIDSPFQLGADHTTLPCLFALACWLTCARVSARVQMEVIATMSDGVEVTDMLVRTPPHFLPPPLAPHTNHTTEEGRSNAPEERNGRGTARRKGR